jgi:peptide/nickel transport system ATP-binding protein
LWGRRAPHAAIAGANEIAGQGARASLSVEPPRPVLRVRDLNVDVATPEGARRVVQSLSFDVAPGETLCVAGESGSGKSLTALSIMRLLPAPTARVAGGSIHLNERDLLALSEAEMRAVRGAEIGMVFQEPMTSLNPVLTIGRQLTEVILAHRAISAGKARQAALEMLERVRIADARQRLQQYPHELSGGMRQRVMIAIAIVCNPRLLIADEPTTALDVTIQAQILSLIGDLQREHNTAVILITHNMGVVAEMADRVVIMHAGRLIEQGTCQAIFAGQEHDYTRNLLAAVPKLGAMAGTDGPLRARAEPGMAAKPPTVVEVSDLTVRFDLRGGVLQRVVRRVHAVESISFHLRRGETLALVGESGCGKTTTGKALVNLIDWEGHISIAGQAIESLPRAAMAAVRRDIQLIFQDPYASLDPRMSVGELVGEPLVIHGLARGSELTDRVAWLFRRVGLMPEHMQRHPHEFSGGQRQRICVARALSLSPKVIVADESVSSLDVSVQSRVLDLLQELQDELGVAYIFISHDMAVVEQISHRVGVMYLGQIVEIGERAQIFEDARHPYTRRLLDAVPVADPAQRRAAFRRIEGEIPSPTHPVGYEPVLESLDEVAPGHLVARRRHNG